MTAVEHVHADLDALANACADRIAGQVERALAERGEAVLVLAGGRTSVPTFRRLAAMPIDWRRVVAVPSDERWVGIEHRDSNLGALEAAFAGTGLVTVALAPTAPSGPVSASLANHALAQMPLAFDAVLLGMGADGHFASLFPGASVLAFALDPASPVDAVALVPEPMPASGPHPRVSLTLSRLLRSRAVLLAITGADKRATLECARHNPATYPVGALLDAPDARVEIHWSP